MKTPSLDELKLAVAKMLPDEIIYDENPLWFWWKEDVDSGIENSQITDREWLHVCSLAEETLTVHQGESYCEILKDVCGCDVDAGKASRVCYFASAEQRLEVLCRVKYPEMFTASTI